MAARDYGTHSQTSAATGPPVSPFNSKSWHGTPRPQVTAESRRAEQAALHAGQGLGTLDSARARCLDAAIWLRLAHETFALDSYVAAHAAELLMLRGAALRLIEIIDSQNLEF